LKVTGKTDVGKVRNSNQDSFACGELPGGAAWAVVCDGMGGANGGGVASTTAVDVIGRRLREGYAGGEDPQAVRALLEDSLLEANRSVFKMASGEPSLYGMGTTVVAAVAAPQTGGVHIAHAGDSRAYLIDSQGIRQLTRDHSIVQEMLESGKLTPEEARAHPQKNIITRALGVEEKLEVDYSETAFEDGAYLLICTDGLSNHVGEPDIAQAVRALEPAESCGELIRLANEDGGSDNITVVVIHKSL
jgi:protein phosphatase